MGGVKTRAEVLRLEIYKHVAVSDIILECHSKRQISIVFCQKLLEELHSKMSILIIVAMYKTYYIEWKKRNICQHTFSFEWYSDA